MKSVARAIVDSVSSDVAGKAAATSERIVNGDFSSNSSWTTNSAWTISGGVATATGAGDLLQTLSFALEQGDAYDFSCTIGGSPASIAIFPDAAGVLDVLYADTPSAGLLSFSGTADAGITAILIRNTGGGAITIDNVSLIA